MNDAFRLNDTGAYGPGRVASICWCGNHVAVAEQSEDAKRIPGAIRPPAAILDAGSIVGRDAGEWVSHHHPIPFRREHESMLCGQVPQRLSDRIDRESGRFGEHLSCRIRDSGDEYLEYSRPHCLVKLSHGSTIHIGFASARRQDRDVW